MNNFKRKEHLELNARLQEDLTVKSFNPAAAESEFEELDRRLTELTQEQKARELAVALVIHGENPDASVAFIATADPYREEAENKPKKAAARLEELAELIEEIRPKWDLARHRRQLVREEKARQLAIAFAPRHQQAVQAIGEAMKAFSAAVALEQTLHHEFQAQMPGFMSLPDFGGQWRAVLLTDPRSAGSAWLSAAKTMGYVK